MTLMAMLMLFYRVNMLAGDYTEVPRTQRRAQSHTPVLWKYKTLEIDLILADRSRFLDSQNHQKP